MPPLIETRSIRQVFGSNSSGVFAAGMVKAMRIHRNDNVTYIRCPSPNDFRFVLIGNPPTSTKVEVRACRDVWAVIEQPGVQSLFIDRDRAIDHARRILGDNPGMIEIRDEDLMLLGMVDLRDAGPDLLACA